MPGISVQLYSVRNELSKDFEGTLEKIARIGYSAVETAALPSGISFQQAAKVIKNAGLFVSAAYMPLPTTPNKKFIFENLSVLGTKHLVAGKREECFKSIDSIKKACEDFNIAADEAEKYDIKILIHNHWWEFENLGDAPIYKTMLENLCEKVNFELDLYWINIAGKEPLAIIKELGKRVLALHIKDGSGIKGDLNMKPAGQGKIKFGPIFNASTEFTEWFVTEFDDCETDIFQALEESYNCISSNIRN